MACSRFGDFIASVRGGGIVAFSMILLSIESPKLLVGVRNYMVNIWITYNAYPGKGFKSRLFHGCMVILIIVKNCSKIRMMPT